MLALYFLACTATLTVQGPPNSNIYVIKDQRPSKTQPPIKYECQDVEESICKVNYFAWDNYYWGVYQGQWVETGKFDNEIKPIPAIVGWFMLWPAWVWAWGPEEKTIHVEK